MFAQVDVSDPLVHFEEQDIFFGLQIMFLPKPKPRKYKSSHCSFFDVEPFCAQNLHGVQIYLSTAVTAF